MNPAGSRNNTKKQKPASDAGEKKKETQVIKQASAATSATLGLVRHVGMRTCRYVEGYFTSSPSIVYTYCLFSR